MAQSFENVLNYDRVAGRKPGLETLRMFFKAALGLHSKEKAGAVGCDEKTGEWEEDMKDKLGGWWW